MASKKKTKRTLSECFSENELRQVEQPAVATEWQYNLSKNQIIVGDRLVAFWRDQWFIANTSGPLAGQAKSISESEVRKFATGRALLEVGTARALYEQVEVLKDELSIANGQLAAIAAVLRSSEEEDSPDD